MPKQLARIFTVSMILISFFISPASSFASQDLYKAVLPAAVAPPAGAGSDGEGTSGKAGCGSVVEWAGKITAKLKVGGGGPLSGSGYDNLTQALKSNCGSTTPPAQQGGQYWCTDLIIDSYSLAGIKLPHDLVAVSLYKKMKAMSGFGHAGPSGTEELKKVKPGYAITFGHSENDGPGGHIGIVKSLDVDDRGNGKIVTYEANSSAPSHTWPIAGGVIKGSHKPVLGFAGKDSGGSSDGSGGGGPVITTSCVITKVGNPQTPPPPLPPQCNAASDGSGGSGGATAAGYVAPSDNNCGGKYTASMAKNPLKKNYGDPNCSFSKDKLYTMFKQKDPKHADLWFHTITKGESGYNPNAIALGGIQNSIDAAGAWGLVQMGSSKPPGGTPDKAGKNGVLDRGDVNWETQVDKALAYNKEKLKCNFRYWATARSVWGKYSC